MRGSYIEMQQLSSLIYNEKYMHSTRNKEDFDVVGDIF